MSKRYEFVKADECMIGLYCPGDEFDDEFVAEGVYVLSLGDPWASAFAIYGTLAEHRALGRRIMAMSAPVPVGSVDVVMVRSENAFELGYDDSDRSNADRYAGGRVMVQVDGLFEYEVQDLAAATRVVAALVDADIVLVETGDERWEPRVSAEGAV